MYSTGTVTTTANSTKLVGTNTKWLNNINRVSAEQAIQIQIDNTVYNNSIQSIQSDTELTLNFPLPTSATGAKYVILTTMVHSVSDAMNKIVSMNGANVQFSDILTRWMTEQGIITVTLPDQTTQQLRTTKEMDKQLDGKLNKLRPEADELLRVRSAGDYASVSLTKKSGERVDIETLPDSSTNSLNIIYRDKEGKNVAVTSIPKKTGTAMLVGEYGLGGSDNGSYLGSVKNFEKNKVGFFSAVHTIEGMTELGITDFYGSCIVTKYSNAMNNQILLLGNYGRDWLQLIRRGGNGTSAERCIFYSDKNTTKDSNGNLKAASPVVKLFADDIELNEESEGVEMEHLGIG
ncbi:phage tail fiber protein, partial [Providencia sp. PROV111]|uniref:phage tail fiber protein n=1 Tax=Providencia sp. PROV111 TaxID=2949822 RepID=UPI00234AB189